MPQPMLLIKGEYAKFFQAIRAKGWLLRNRYVHEDARAQPRSEVHLWLHNGHGIVLPVWYQEDGSFYAHVPMTPEGQRTTEAAIAEFDRVASTRDPHVDVPLTLENVEALQRLLNRERPVRMEVPAWGLWAGAMFVQLALKHPHAAANAMAQPARRFAESALGALTEGEPGLRAIADLGWGRPTGPYSLNWDSSMAWEIVRDGRVVETVPRTGDDGDPTDDQNWPAAQRRVDELNAAAAAEPRP